MNIGTGRHQQTTTWLSSTQPNLPDQHWYWASPANNDLVIVRPPPAGRILAVIGTGGPVKPSIIRVTRVFFFHPIVFGRPCLTPSRLCAGVAAVADWHGGGDERADDGGKVHCGPRAAGEPAADAQGEEEEGAREEFEGNPRLPPVPPTII
eukprot:557767-Pyramimonas_sp.AAC.2